MAGYWIFTGVSAKGFFTKIPLFLETFWVLLLQYFSLEFVDSAIVNIVGNCFIRLITRTVAKNGCMLFTIYEDSK